MSRLRVPLPLLALDDTDTPESGCTTHTAFQIAKAIEQAGGPLREWGLIAPARLVRLNPAAPHRTRGNGALVLPIGPKPAGAKVQIGTWEDGRPIMVPKDPAPEGQVGPDSEQALQRLVCSILPRPGAEERDPQPGALLLPRPPAPGLYRLAVSRMVDPQWAWQHAPEGTLRLTEGPRRGETGALAASAWRAAHASDGRSPRWSWEYIRYRHSLTIDRQEELPTDFTDTLERLPGGFDNLDLHEGRTRAVPRTPCPVLFGVRARDPQALLHAFSAPGEDPAPGWLLVTNHATGDHARYAPSTLGPHQVTCSTVTITGRPERRKGGHLFVPADLEGHGVTLAAFEPTKGLRDALQATRPGDRLRVLARTREDAHLLALEAFRVEHLAPRCEPGGNPRCPRCGGGTKSRGELAGYRCPRCRVRLEENTRARRVLEPTPLALGALFQVPDHVRGHLLPPVSGLGPSGSLQGGRPSEAVPPVLAEDHKAPRELPVQAPV